MAGEQTESGQPLEPRDLAFQCNMAAYLTEVVANALRKITDYVDRKTPTDFYDRNAHTLFNWLRELKEDGEVEDPLFEIVKKSLPRVPQAVISRAYHQIRQQDPITRLYEAVKEYLRAA